MVLMDSRAKTSQNILAYSFNTYHYHYKQLFVPDSFFNCWGRNLDLKKAFDPSKKNLYNNRRMGPSEERAPRPRNDPETPRPPIADASIKNASFLIDV